MFTSQRPTSKTCLPFLILGLAMLLGSCTKVGDIVEQWKKSGTDAALEGTWTSSEGITHFVKQAGGHYLMASTNSEEAYAVKTFEAGGHTFMIWAGIAAVWSDFDTGDKDDCSGKIVRYTFSKKDVLNFHALQDDYVKEAITKGKVQGTVGDDQGGETQLSVLDDATLKFFAQAAEAGHAWQKFGGDMAKTK